MTPSGQSDIHPANELAKIIHAALQRQADVAEPGEVRLTAVEGTRFVIHQDGLQPLEVVVIQR